MHGSVFVRNPHPTKARTFEIVLPREAIAKGLRACPAVGEVEQILEELTPEQLRAVCSRSALRFTAALEVALTPTPTLP